MGERLLELLSWRDKVVRRKPEVCQRGEYRGDGGGAGGRVGGRVGEGGVGEGGRESLGGRRGVGEGAEGGLLRGSVVGK